MQLRDHVNERKIPNSYSRELDLGVQATEMPYGYTNEPPPADTGDFDQARLETKVMRPVRHGKVS
jgi:hypothetical protein